MNRSSSARRSLSAVRQAATSMLTEFEQTLLDKFLEGEPPVLGVLREQPTNSARAGCPLRRSLLYITLDHPDPAPWRGASVDHVHASREGEGISGAARRHARRLGRRRSPGNGR